MGITSKSLLRELEGAVPPDTASASKISERAAHALRPPGALARLDELASWIAAWQGTDNPTIRRTEVLVFAGSHGVVVDGVSAFTSDVNSEILAAIQTGKASISALARSVGAQVTAVDTGLAEPTGNLRTEPALSDQRFAQAFIQGRSAVASSDADLIAVGEVGIGNTTSAAAVTTALMTKAGKRTVAAIDRFVGVGAGLGAEARRAKSDVVFDAVKRIDDIRDPLMILTQLGGTELAAIAGAVFEARITGRPVLLDGYVTSAPVLALHAITADAVANVRAGHRSAEPGHSLVLERLEMTPLIDLGLRLGEGSGAVAAFPLVAMACRAVVEVPTFDEWFGPEK